MTHSAESRGVRTERGSVHDHLVAVTADSSSRGVKLALNIEMMQVRYIHKHLLLLVVLLSLLLLQLRQRYSVARAATGATATYAVRLCVQLLVVAANVVATAPLHM